MDTRWWNLAVVGVAACGPSVGVPEDGEAGSGGAELCLLDGGCDEGMICEEGYCVPGERPEPDYGESGCSHYYTCYEQYCDDDEDCYMGQLCLTDAEGSQYCDTLEALDPCASDLMLIPTPVAVVDDVEDLRFIDADDDDRSDLAIVTGSDVQIVFGSGAPPTVLAELGYIEDVAAGDFDRDGIRDLAVAIYGSERARTLALFAGNGDGTFTPTAGVEHSGWPERIVGLTWDAEGIDDDLLVLDAGRLEVWSGPSFGGGPMQIAGGVLSFAVADLDQDGRDDVVTASDEGTWVSTGLTLFEPDRPRSAVAVGHFNGSESPIVVAFGAMPNGWVLVESSAFEGPTFTPQSRFSGGRPAASGDVDGDGVDDLVLHEDGYVKLMRGGNPGGNGPLFACEQRIADATAVTVGDVDADGRAEIAIANGDEVTILSSR